MQVHTSSLKQSYKKGLFIYLLTLTLDLSTKKYPVPLARHTSLHRSLGEIPAYLGTHSTPSPEPSDTWADMSLWARHCSSRNDRPGKETQRGQIYCLFSLTSIANFHTNVQGTSKHDFYIQTTPCHFFPYIIHFLKKSITFCKSYPR